jgi:hypothetical protein
MTCYETVCTIVQILGFLILAIMVYSIKAKERAEEEEAKRVTDYNFYCGHYKAMEQVYKHEAEEYRKWQIFGFKYGCRSPEEMRVLIDDLVRKINKLEANNGTH